MKWLEAGFPDEAIQSAQNLSARADHLVAGVDKLDIPNEVDVVCGGGGNYDGYYMGVSMVLQRMQSKIIVERYAGASAGGMMPFEVALKGEQQTLQMHLAYGILMQKYPGQIDGFGNMASAAALQDHHWRLMSDWMTKKWEAQLPTLDCKVHLALSCLDPLPKLVMVSNFTSQSQADHAFMGTGTAYETYDGMPCSDGGAMSGKKMTPLFQDSLRGQIIVDLMQTGTGSYPYKYSLSQYAAMIEKGQDETIGFLKTGTCRAEAIAFCPLGSKTSANICEKKK